MPITVAIQGTHGSYSDAATHRLWPDATLLPRHEPLDVAVAVRDGSADAGVLPVENALVGALPNVLDLLYEQFADGALTLTHEMLLPIHHTLAAPPGATRDGIMRVFSHPVALSQCRRFLERELAYVEVVSAWDTAGSAELVAQTGDRSWAAIASPDAARRLGLTVLAEGIADQPSNQTRFLAFRRATDAAAPAARAKTSIVVQLGDRPGALARCLAAFGTRGVNLTALHSRPEPTTPWAYRFFLDLEGAAADPGVAAALDEVRGHARRVLVLGSYGASPAP